MFRPARKTLVLGIAIFCMASCSLPIRPIHAIRQETASYNLPSEYNMGAMSYQSGALPLGYSPVNSTLSELEDGFVLIKNNLNGHIGAYSPLLDTIIVPADYVSIDLIKSRDNGVYLRAHRNGVFDVFDFLGYLVVQGVSDSAKFFLSAEKATLPCQEQKLIEEYRIGDAVTLSSIGSDRTRTPFFYPSFMFMQDDYSFLPSTFDLTAIGLPGYSGSLNSAGLFTTSHGEETNSQISVDALPDVRLCFWKALFTQENIIVTGDDYDYAMKISGQETRFKMMTQQIALVNGEIKKLTVPYLIESIRPMYNENKQAHYALVYAFSIVDKQLASDLSIFVIDNEGQITYDATADAAYQYGVSFITPYKMYDYITGSLIDFDFNVIGTIPGSVVDHNSTWEILKATSNGVPCLFGFEGQPLIVEGYSSFDIDVAPDDIVYAITSSGQSVGLQPYTGMATPIRLGNGQHVQDCGLGTIRIDSMNNGSTVSSEYLTYSQYLFHTVSAPYFSTGTAKTMFLRSFSDAFFDSQTQTYSFYSGICRY